MSLPSLSQVIAATIEAGQIKLADPDTNINPLP
jgi:hypothetical protein